MKRTLKRTASLLTAALVLVTVACGETDESSTTTEAPASESTADVADTVPGDASDGAFPTTIEHAFGETIIETEPQRIVSVGYGEHDGLLAIGVVPIAVRDWYGDQPFATWPWAQDELGDATPEVLPSTELNFEQIAALDPDLIVGISSGMTDTDYATLSAIAPTVARPDGSADYGTPWDVSLEIAGRATGRSDEAAQVIADTRQLFVDTAAAHPEFDQATATVTFFFEGQPGTYASSDVRSQALTELGFIIPEEIDELAGDAFFVSISSEDLSPIDTDVVVWIGDGAETFENIRDLPTRASTRAFQEGREVVADDLLSAAFSHSSPLSLEYVIEYLVPELALAVDGDPATEVPSAAMIAPGGDASEGSADAADAAAEAWSLAFDSAVGFEDKAAHIEDAEALRATIESYTAAGSAMGGITLVPTDVAVNGESATVTYDVMFGPSAAYTDLSGLISLVDGTWVVSRTEFCTFMASARNACPT
jgi:iron complex transport system substrate-binding protein